MTTIDQSDPSYKVEVAGTPFCGLPIVSDRPLDANIDPHRESLIRYIEKKWVNRTVLHYHFLDGALPAAWRGDAQQRKVVDDSFAAWKTLGIGLEFQKVTDPNDAEIRIGFEPGSSWSLVGRDAIDFAPNTSERTMNFGWDLTTNYGGDTALHEIGHALGFPHEHQNPNAGIAWDETAVYTFFAGAPNFWHPNKTHHNVIRKISPTAVHGSAWDRDSIMHYQFPAGLIFVPQEFQHNPLIPQGGLSPADIAEVLKFYPGGTQPTLPELKPYLSHLVQISAGEQMDFTISPQVSRKYWIQTFGALDTVIVLFEDTNAGPVYLAGDDDSGKNFNSRLRVRLLKNRTYTLRLRMYHAAATGEGGIMVW